MFAIVLLSTALLGSAAMRLTATVASGGPQPAVSLRLDDDGRYQPGDRAKVSVQSRDDGYLLVVQIDPDKHVRVLFPLNPGDDNFVRGGKRYDVQGRGGRETFTVGAHRGQGTVYAAVSPEPLHFDSYAAGGHWDLRALDSLQVSDDPEADLNEFVRTLTTAHFQYDLYPYQVSQRYANAYLYPYPYYDYWGWPFYGGPRFFLGLGFGHVYRPFYGRVPRIRGFHHRR